MHRAFVLLLTAVFLLSGMSGCGRNEKQGAPKQNEKIILAVSSWPASAPIYVAHEKGFFEKEGLSATIQPYLSGHLRIDREAAGNGNPPNFFLFIDAQGLSSVSPQAVRISGK